MLVAGASVVAHDGSVASARKTVSRVIEKPKVVLHHQYERAVKGVSFFGTILGRKVREDPDLADEGMRDFFKGPEPRQPIGEWIQEGVWYLRRCFDGHDTAKKV